jgi:hypothetical protein
MKRFSIIILSIILTISLFCPALSASAAQPSGYWPYLKAYTDSTKSGDVAKILSTGDALLKFYSQFPINRDIAATSYNIYLYRYQNAVFEKKGYYDKAIANAQKLVYFSKYLGFNDMAVAASARIEKLTP